MNFREERIICFFLWVIILNTWEENRWIDLEECKVDLIVAI
jgi:hypothetical protein